MATPGNSLAALAMDHPDTGVQIEAAWASGYRGGTAGLTFLVRMCEDPNHSLGARQYLEELGQEDRIPAKALEPNFDAMAQMCQWLMHPNEFGEPPTEIELYDTRELHWPPTDDDRRVWLFKYTYAPHKEDQQRRSRFGNDRSITFALFGETTADMSPEDVCGIHCCWGVGDQRRPRARRNAPRKPATKVAENLR